ncbi:MarR family winged helix-turn-helix transcriptional regulator [Streptomyces sp. NPDC058401]|uniref:MarR family winged helix-turn-helix transcriptional regulator n=1 Tax=Streptomyces sp. NPDC058401 TaxID=3346480 RepID=UPI00365391B6
MPAEEEPEMSDPRWLTADQLAAWRSVMSLLKQLPTAVECQLQRDSQLSFVEYYVLVLLSEQPGRRVRMSDLSTLSNLELSRLSHMARRLEKRGILAREPDPTDGRYVHAILTDAGSACLTEAAPGHVNRVRDLFIDALTPEELQALRRSADKVVARINKVAERSEKAPPGGRHDLEKPSNPCLPDSWTATDGSSP